MKLYVGFSIIFPKLFVHFLLLIIAIMLLLSVKRYEISLLFTMELFMISKGM